MPLTTTPASPLLRQAVFTSYGTTMKKSLVGELGDGASSVSRRSGPAGASRKGKSAAAVPSPTRSSGDPLSPTQGEQQRSTADDGHDTHDDNDEDDDDVSKSKWSTLFSRFNQDLYLENVGSVARDHLANERTFLAWLRTSLSLASIGVAITQLFRLSSSTYSLPSNPDPNIYSLAPGAELVTQAAVSTVEGLQSDTDIRDMLASLISTVQRQQLDLDALGTSTRIERHRFHQLGKPIGGSFIMLGLLFLVLGGHRYLSVQFHLSNKNFFPPARRSVLVSSAFVCSLLVGAFVSVLVIK